MSFIKNSAPIHTPTAQEGSFPVIPDLCAGIHSLRIAFLDDFEPYTDTVAEGFEFRIRNIGGSPVI
jgi:hypothetical protein